MEDRNNILSNVRTAMRLAVMTMLIAMLVGLASCSKDTADEPFKPLERRTVLLLTNEGVIYDQNYEQVTQLPHCTYASQIITEGNDYFVSGTYENGSKVRVGYWKNGRWNTLHVDFIDDVDHWIYGIGKWDCYIYLLDHPNVLKNSGIFPIENGADFAPAEQALAVSEGKCYVVGGKVTDEDGMHTLPVLYTERKGRYAAQVLPLPDGSQWGCCTSVYAYDEVHTLIGGWIDNFRPVVWHDKQLRLLPLTQPINGIYSGEVRSVTTADGHIYAVGNEVNEHGEKVATMWCDDQIQHLQHLQQDAEAYWSMAVEVMNYGGDIYVVTVEYGFNADGETVPVTVLWLNGEYVKSYPGLQVQSFTVI